MKYELKKVDYWSVIKIGFFINIVLGFIIGIFYAMMMKAVLMTGGPMGSMLGDFDGAEGAMDIALVIMPFLFSFGNAFFGTILYVIIAFLYNLLARLMGGFVFELNDPVQPEPVRYQHPPVYAQPQPQSKPAPEPPPPPPPPPPPIEPAPPEIAPKPEMDEKREDHNDDKYKL